MKWITKSHLHLDRAATAWLITRFIDPEAEFSFQDWDRGAPDGDGEPIAFGIRGAALGSHDRGGTGFAKVIATYEIDDAAVACIERVVDAGVRHALGRDAVEDQTEEERTLGTALDYLGEGLAMGGDETHLTAATMIYDGLYALFQVRLLPADVRSAAPEPLPARITYLREAVDKLGAEAVSEP